MAAETHPWGAERIRGEGLNLGIQVSTRTVQTDLRHTRPLHHQRQPGRRSCTITATRSHACDVLPVTDRWLRSLCAFFLMELGSRQLIPVRTTRHTTDAWITQQRREATPFGVRPRYLLQDDDSKVVSQVARVAATSGIDVLHTPLCAPRANAICERVLGSVRRECLDHVLIFHERHLQRLLQEYVDYFNHARPRQGIDQAIPGTSGLQTDRSQGSQTITSLPILGGLHHDYRFAA